MTIKLPPENIFDTILKAFGKDVVTDMCQRLLDNGAPGLHFYSMNQTEATLSIWNDLEL